MTSPVATVGLFYDTEDLQRSDLGVFFRIVRGLNEPPGVRGSDTIVPALAGRSEGLRINDIIRIELVGLVQPDAGLTTDTDQKESYRVNALYVRELFRPARTTAQLIAVLEDGSQLVIVARPMNAIWTERIASTVAEVSVELEAYDDWAIVGS